MPTATYFRYFCWNRKIHCHYWKHEAVAYLTQFDIPCAPVLRWKKFHLIPLCAKVAVLSKWTTVAWKISDSWLSNEILCLYPDIKAAPLLGEHTAAVLQELVIATMKLLQWSKTTPSDINGASGSQFIKISRLLIMSDQLKWQMVCISSLKH